MPARATNLVALDKHVGDVAALTESSSVEVEHYLATMLHPEIECIAGQALKTCGLSYEMVLDAIGKIRGADSGSGQSPASHVRAISTDAERLRAMAEGLALGRGEEAAPEHLLIAFIWHEEQWRAPTILRQLGVERESVRRELVTLGVQMPPLPFPPRRRWSPWRVVSYSEITAIRSGEVPYLIGRTPDGLMAVCTEIPDAS